jgi:hypothetical protein
MTCTLHVAWDERLTGYDFGPAYIDIVRLLGPGEQELTERVLLMHGLGTEDDPVFRGMHEAAAMVTGATLAAARAVWMSAAQHGPASRVACTTPWPGTPGGCVLSTPWCRGAGPTCYSRRRATRSIQSRPPRGGGGSTCRPGGHGHQEGRLPAARAPCPEE